MSVRKWCLPRHASTQVLNHFYTHRELAAPAQRYVAKAHAKRSARVTEVKYDHVLLADYCG
jgi:hypothetical protein